MGQLVVSTFLTLDGVMQGPGGPGEDDSDGFPHGGWLVPFADADMGRIMDDQFRRAEALLIGRRTYDIFSAHWPRVDDPGDPLAAKINSMPKYVATRTLRRAEWHGTQLLEGDAGDAVARLKDTVPGEILVQGSGDLIRTLQRRGLVDIYRLLTFPVVLGQGKRLFEPGTPPVALRLTGSETTKAGVVFSTYVPEGRPQYGSFMLDEPA